MPLSQSLTTQLPADSHVEEIVYAPLGDKSTGGLHLPKALQRKAVVLDRQTEPDRPADLTMLTIPSDKPQEESTLAALRDWVDEEATGEESACMTLTFQAVLVFWSPKRIAVIADAQRLGVVRASLIETTVCVSELLAIEQDLAVRWPELEADTPLAFNYNAEAIPRQRELSQRFENTYRLRSQLARVSPLLQMPHVYPPTLASQIGERLRERLRVIERVEFVSDQLEVFEEIYEMCGQRMNDFRHARSGNTLEWIIILLLVAEVFLTVFDYLTVASS